MTTTTISAPLIVGDTLYSVEDRWSRDARAIEPTLTKWTVTAVGSLKASLARADSHLIARSVHLDTWFASELARTRDIAVQKYLKEHDRRVAAARSALDAREREMTRAYEWAKRVFGEGE